MAKRNEKKEPVIVENIISDTLDELMGMKYAIYAKDVIQDRAIPDARDGLKPVQRRIIFDMFKTGNTIDKPTKKCAHIVGDVMGKYHPHGDSSIYEALVHMSQPWAYRYPLIDFQGNNGSIDGDGPAAYRYTEARLSALSNELVADLDRNTVDMELTFDDTELEPTVLPCRFPNLLANGAEGIAVGIATSIPPHNLRELVSAISYRIKHPNCDMDALLRYVPGPDFPTGGIIYENDALKDIYRTGKGKVTISSRYEIIDEPNKPKQIIITEIPYRTNKSELVKAIDQIRHDKTIPGIDEVRDETDKSGLRIAIDLKDEAKPSAIIAYLLQKTPLKTNYSAHMVAIVDNRPKTMDLISYCDCYIAHQLDVISRRTRFNLEKDQARLNIVEGLIHAISILDEVVKVIRASQDKSDAKKNIEAAFGFNDAQAEAIVMMPLYKLSHTDVTTLENEAKSLHEDIDYLNLLLSNQDKREDVIIADLNRIAKTYGDKRRTEIRPAEEENIVVNKRDLIAEEETMVVATRDGYVKRSSLKSWKGSGGHNGIRPGVKAGDAFVFECQCLTTDYLILFTSKGNYAYIPVNDIKEAKWNDEGFHLSSLISIPAEDKLIGGFAVRHFRNDLYILMLTAHGYIKRVPLSSLEVVRHSKAIGAIRLSKDDRLIDVAYTGGNDTVFVFSEDGKVSAYNENEIQISNPRTSGVKAGSFRGKELAGLLTFLPDEKSEKILLVTNRGCTRVVDLSHYTPGHRLDKAAPLFDMFKKEPHEIVYLEKVGDKTAPYSLDAVMEDGTRSDIVFDDFYLTPSEKYVKRPDAFPAKARIIQISQESSPLLDDSIPSTPLPEKPAEPEEAPEAEEKKESDEFEQLSLFDDLDDLDHK